MLSRFIPVVEMCQSFTPCMDIPLSFIHLSVAGLLGCFHFLTIMNTDVIIIHIQVFVRIYIFSYFGYIPRSGIAGWVM